jgi:hypothetical protein
LAAKPDRLKAVAQATGRAWICGRNGARQLYAKAA